MARVSIFLVALALVVGMVVVGMVDYDGTSGVYNPHPSENLEIWTWYYLDAIRDNLGGSYLLMNDLDSTTPGYEELASWTANQEDRAGNQLELFFRGLTPLLQALMAPSTGKDMR